MSLRTLLQEFALTVESSGNMVVVTTTLGAASAVAEGLDHSAIPEILGAVAGDNTIFIVVQEGLEGREVAQRLRGLGGIQ